MEENRNRAAIYARFSSHNQRSESIEIQVEKSRAYCEEHSLEVVRIYTDYAHTGTNTDRDGFQRMMADAKEGIFDYVVIYKVTRIMRNRDEMAVARIMLRKAGVEILYAGESLGGGSTRVLQLGMLEVLAEYESALNAERVRDGIQKNAERGMANGQVRYGWDIVGGYYQVNEHEAGVLRKMRDMLLTGRTVAEIADSFPAERTRRGNRFTFSTVDRLLRREQNCGVYDYAGARIEGGMPALWSRDEQERIVSALDSRYRAHRKINAAEEAPLSGKMWCTECGRFYTGTSGTGKSGKVYTYYRCPKCRRTFRRDIAEEAVYDAIIESLARPSIRTRIKEWWAAYNMEVAGEEDGRADEIARLRKELHQIDTAFENIWKAIEAGDTPPGCTERIQSLKTHKEELEIELKKAEEEESSALTWEEFSGWLDSLAVEPDPAYIIDMFVRVIAVTGDELRLCFAFDGSIDDFPFEPNENTRLEGGCSQDFMWRPVCKPLRTPKIELSNTKVQIEISPKWMIVVTVCERPDAIKGRRKQK